jgi:FixJ family two-component response regulator
VNDSPPTVFVVDDDPSIRKAMSRLLRAAGFDVSTYECAQDYLDRYDPEAPGCLLLDLTMPRLSGLELQQALASRGGAPPIIFLSGHADIPAGVQAMKDGAVEFLTKPVDGAALLAAVRKAIDKDRVERTLRAARVGIGGTKVQLPTEHVADSLGNGPDKAAHRRRR